LKITFYFYELIIYVIIIFVSINIYTFIFLQGPVTHSDILWAAFFPVIIGTFISFYLSRKIIFKKGYHFNIVFKSFLLQLLCLPIWIFFFIKNESGLHMVQLFTALVGYLSFIGICLKNEQKNNRKGLL
jgi:hypothetical protein